MDLIQLTKLVQFIDEERRKDRVLIAQLQEQVAGLMQEAERARATRNRWRRR